MVKQLRSSVLVVLTAVGLSACGEKPPLHHEEFLYSSIGNSDVLGVGAFPLSNGYTFRIQSELRDLGRDVIHLPVGVPGMTTERVTDTVRRAVDGGLSSEFVTVWVGASDVIDGVPIETFSQALKELLFLLQDEMEAYVIIANLPPMHSFPSLVEEPQPEVTEQRIGQFNAIIDTEALARGIPLIDLSEGTLSDHLVVDFDGLHPDDEGHERLAKLFMNAIRPEL